MKWDKARRVYPNKWLLFEAIEASSEGGKRLNGRKKNKNRQKVQAF